MTKARLKELERWFRSQNTRYPDHGRSERPWERYLRDEILAEIRNGLAAGSDWAKPAADRWHVDPDTGEVIPL